MAISIHRHSVDACNIQREQDSIHQRFLSHIFQCMTQNATFQIIFLNTFCCFWFNLVHCRHDLSLETVGVRILLSFDSEQS